MPDRATLLRRLYYRRVERGVCVKCEQPTGGRVYCADCRSDQAAKMRQRRYLTPLAVVVIEAHSSTGAA